MAKIGEVIRKKHPEVYRQLMFMYPTPKGEEDETSFREAENLMRNSAYVRGHGGSIKQIRH